jgi:hypothetical protein
MAGPIGGGVDPGYTAEKYLPATAYATAGGVLAAAFVAVLVILVASPEKDFGEVVLVAGLSLDLVAGAWLVRRFEARREFIYTSLNKGLDELASLTKQAGSARIGKAGEQAETALKGAHAFREAAVICQARRDALLNARSRGS